MKINPPFKRRIRIEGPDYQLAGWSLRVTDIETGETVDSIKAVTVCLRADGANEAEIFYYETNEAGNLAIGDDGPIVNVVVTPDPEISLTASERVKEDDTSEQDKDDA